MFQKTGTYNWAGIFTEYDVNKDNLLDKIELKKMMEDSKFSKTPVTDAEVAFTHNVMSFFQKHLNKRVFLEWV